MTLKNKEPWALVVVPQKIPRCPPRKSLQAHRLLGSCGVSGACPDHIPVLERASQRKNPLYHHVPIYSPCGAMIRLGSLDQVPAIYDISGWTNLG
jgi:hypothetical protein